MTNTKGWNNYPEYDQLECQIIEDVANDMEKKYKWLNLLDEFEIFNNDETIQSVRLYELLPAGRKAQHQYQNDPEGLAEFLTRENQNIAGRTFMSGVKGFGSKVKDKFAEKLAGWIVATILVPVCLWLLWWLL